jgi:hypothetical protein
MKTEELRVNVNGGYIRATISEDPDYPGIDIEFVPNDYDGKTTNPRVLIEQPIDRDDILCRALVWEDKDDEDFTKEIEWEGRRK